MDFAILLVLKNLSKLYPLTDFKNCITKMDFGRKPYCIFPYSTDKHMPLRARHNPLLVFFKWF